MKTQLEVWWCSAIKVIFLILFRTIRLAWKLFIEMAPFRKGKYPDLDSGPRRKLCLPRTSKAIKNQAEPVMKKLREGCSINDLNSTEKELKKLHENVMGVEKYEQETGNVAHWSKFRKSCKDQKKDQRKEDRNDKRSPTPIKANDDNEELILDNFENDNMIESAMPIEEPVASSTRTWNEPVADIDSVEPSPIGALQNIGNSCYMNAALYALRFIPGFLHSLHHLCINMLILFDEIEFYDSAPEDGCARTRATAEFISNRDQWPEFEMDMMTEKRRILAQLHEVYSKLARFEVENEKSVALRPIQFQRYARNINPIFVRGTQQDSHEMVICILGSLQDCSKEYSGLVNNNQDIFRNINGDAATLLSFNYFNEYFVGNRISKLCCIDCESVRIIHDVVVDLTIPLTSEMIVDEDFIKHSCLQEQIFKASEKVKCDECVGNSEMKQTFSYEKLPRIMVVHLGRFDNQLNKVNIATPTPFNFDCFCIDCMESIRINGTSIHQYTLVSVILHLGSTLKSGHYISYVRAPNQSPQPQPWCPSQTCCKVNAKMNELLDEPAETNNLWYICDDHRITKIQKTDLQEKLKNEAQWKTPYLLFYVRNDILTAE